ncbi:MAG: alpha/beta fold hydrolase [Betaproteobacteria bacterium]
MASTNARGPSTPLVLIPGIQGRWEFMRPTVAALRRSFDVLTFSLEGDSVEHGVEQVRRVLDAGHVDRAVICGISFGGVVALRFAADYPGRTQALVLVSTPGPDWHLSPQHERYSRHPRLYGPLFLVQTPLRLRAEIARAIPSPLARLRFALAQFATLLSAPLSCTRMAGRARAVERSNRAEASARVTAPTLVVTGEPGLDHVVPVDGTSAYAHLIRGATYVTLPGTGHVGSITRPDEFADLVHGFVQDQHAAA